MCKNLEKRVKSREKSREKKQEIKYLKKNNNNKPIKILEKKENGK